MTDIAVEIWLGMHVVILNDENERWRAPVPYSSEISKHVC